MARENLFPDDRDQALKAIRKAAKSGRPAARKGKAVAARKDAEGQEQVIELDRLRKSLPDLQGLYRRKAEAGAALSDAVKAAAEASGLQAAAVRKFLAARCGADFEKASRHAEQLGLLFGEIGE